MKLLAPLLALYVILASVHLYLVPVGTTGYQNAPDEAAHVTYVHMVASGRLPTRTRPSVDGSQTPSYEWHQPPLYYILAALFLGLGEKGMRACSILVGFGCILLIYRTARILFPNDPQTAITSAGIAALIPGHIAITSVVNNDGLLEMSFSLFLLGAIGSMVLGLERKWSLLMGIGLGAGLLTKATAIVLVPLLLFAFALMVRAGEDRKRALREITIVLGLALVMSGWWYIRNAILYHEWLPVRAFQQSFEGTMQARTVVAGQSGLPVQGWGEYFLLVARWTFQSFWAVYGTAKSAAIGAPRFLPDQLYLLAALITAISIGGLMLRRFRQNAKSGRRQVYSMWILFAACGLVCLAFSGFVLRYFQAQGRYFYPVMLPLSLLLSVGWRAVFPDKYSRVATIFLLGILAAMSIAFLRYVS